MTTDLLDLTDQPDRTSIEEDLKLNLFVEAGAGSGKTRELVERLCAMVDDGAELRRVAAITFTEKAAGELRERVRKSLTDLRDQSDPSGLRQRALDQLDTAPIGTIHSFAARLISEHPIEAGVPPLITVVDELRSKIAFTQRWEDIRHWLFHDPTLDDALRLLLAAGVTLDHLRNVAAELDANWDRLESHPPQRRPMPVVDLGPLLRSVEDVLEHAGHCTSEDDLLYRAIRNIEPWHGRLGAVDATDLGDLMDLLDAFPATPQKGGRKPNWPAGVDTVRTSCNALADAASDLRNSLIAPAVDTVVAAMAELLLDAARQRQRSGDLEFADLLIHARNLLVGTDERTVAVHQTLRERYSCILLDEFQDTDPVQAELATRLAATDTCGAEGWEQLTVEAGRLFTVGDPKQSIYRFRRADIATYLAAQRRFEGDEHARVASLSTNFRSTEPLLAWLNDTFGELITEQETLQPAYRPLTVDPLRPAWNESDGPAVAVVGRGGTVPDESGKATADAMRRQEADAVAAAILRATGQTGAPAWQKQAKRSDGPDSFLTSPLSLRDICILLPTRAALAALEDSLDGAGIEYRAEASSLVYSTQEVTDLLLALRAIANTADEAALVLALRSAPFGCGDDDLLEWKQAGGYWNLFAQPPEDLAESQVAKGMRYLARRCREISVRTPAELMDQLVADRRMLETVTSSPRYRDVWRRLRFVIDQARAWSEATHGSLRDYLVWAGSQQEENARVREAVVPETDVDAVRIMTIHASKGLEFPMVILAGTGTGFANDAAPAIWDDASRVHVRFVSGIQSSGYNDAKTAEDQFDRAEKRRLLYVACTRAESHLVVSLFVGGRSCLGKLLEKFVGADVVTDLDAVDSVSRQAARVAHHPAPVPAWGEWQRAQARWQERSAVASTTSVTALAKGASTGDAAFPITFMPLNDDETLPAPAAPGAEHGTEFGTALHRVMELSGLQESADVESIADDVARSMAATPESLAVVARSALACEPVRRAAGRERWLELPVVVPSGELIVEGVIDLMYREDDGTLVIADFKTDKWVSSDTMAGYWRQLSQYASMVQGITGQRVSELVLIFCRAEGAEVLRRGVV